MDGKHTTNITRGETGNGDDLADHLFDNVADTHLLEVLVRWAKGTRLTNRLPNLSLIIIPPPGTDRIFTGRRATTRGSNFWGSRSHFQILDMRKLTFLLKSDFMVDVRFELTTNDPCPADDAIC